MDFERVVAETEKRFNVEVSEALISALLYVLIDAPPDVVLRRERVMLVIPLSDPAGSDMKMEKV